MGNKMLYYKMNIKNNFFGKLYDTGTEFIVVKEWLDKVENGITGSEYKYKSLVSIGNTCVVMDSDKLNQFICTNCYLD